MRAPQPARPGTRSEHRDPHLAPPVPDHDQPDDTLNDNTLNDDTLNDKLDDEDYPAYSMGRAAELLGVTPAFLRSLDAAKLFVPQRSTGGHRRYSRYQLRLAQRAHDMVDHGTALDAACHIIILQDQLAEAHRINTQLRRHADQPPTQT